MKKAIIVLSTILTLVSCNKETTDKNDSTLTGVNVLDLSTITSESSDEDRTAKGKCTLFGTLPVKKPIFIADGATVTLRGVSINANKAWNGGDGAGVTCLGDATLILGDDSFNTVRSLHEDYPGITVPVGKTLTIKGEKDGTGRLTVSGTPHPTGAFHGCGIGGGFKISCGNIVIRGGNITAEGGVDAAGIGCGYGSNGTQSTCGNITIDGGIVTAIGGNTAPGIGSGNRGTCGDIVITNQVTCVTAVKGTGNAPDCIGIGEAGNCGKIYIGGVETGRIHDDQYTYKP